MRGWDVSVPPAAEGQPLLEFLSARLLHVSKTALRRLVASGRVRVNGDAWRPAGRLRPGDTVNLPADLAPAPPPEQELPVEVIYEDADHLCVNKPAGWPTMPGRGGQGAEFFRSLVAHVNAGAPPGGPYCRPHAVHRLDRETSGVLLVAKNVEAGRALSTQFLRHSVEKEYLAVVEGRLPLDEVRLDIPMEREPGGTLRMRAALRGGKPAVTVVRAAERFGHFTLVCAQPLTGRQHQVRVHLAAAGYPLAVDGAYGRRDRLTGADLNALVGAHAAAASAVVLGRCPLHAASIGYRHPVTRALMRLAAPLPADLEALLAVLRRADPPGPSVDTGASGG